MVLSILSINLYLNNNLIQPKINIIYIYFYLEQIVSETNIKFNWLTNIIIYNNSNLIFIIFYLIYNIQLVNFLFT